VSEQSSHTNVDLLTRTQLNMRHGWSNVDRPSTVSVDSVTVDGAVCGRPSLSSSSRQTVPVDSNSWVSSVAAVPLPNNGLLLPDFSVCLYMNSCSVAASFSQCYCSLQMSSERS